MEGWSEVSGEEEFEYVITKAKVKQQIASFAAASARKYRTLSLAATAASNRIPG